MSGREAVRVGRQCTKRASGAHEDFKHCAGESAPVPLSTSRAAKSVVPLAPHKSWHSFRTHQIAIESSAAAPSRAREGHVTRCWQAQFLSSAQDTHTRAQDVRRHMREAALTRAGSAPQCSPTCVCLLSLVLACATRAHSIVIGELGRTGRAAVVGGRADRRDVCVAACSASICPADADANASAAAAAKVARRHRPRCCVIERDLRRPTVLNGAASGVLAGNAEHALSSLA